jgi:crotonobetainyl-CoA:carnitine CoA-transferase CaiB-like acyl-CoA transferase
MKPLQHFQVLSLAINLPGPLAVSRLHEFGASVVKIEPPTGDPLGHACPDWYTHLHAGMEILRLDLRDGGGRTSLYERLGGTDLLITANRPAALTRLGLAWPDLHARWPRLCHVALIGYPPPDENRPGHDLNFQAQVGLVMPPNLPRTCVADLAGAEEVVSASLALLLARERGQGSNRAEISLARAAGRFAEPLWHGLCAPGAILGGGLPGYNLYPTAEAWLAVAALEPHFQQKLQQELGLASLSQDALATAFRLRTADEWEKWAAERGLPITAVRQRAE